jgi:hypothetical protein
MRRYLLLILFSHLLLRNPIFSLTKFYINTDYKLSYNNYSNIDFGKTSNNDFEKIYSNLNLNLKTLIDEFEFNLTLNSIGEVGCDRSNYYVKISTVTKFKWEQELPYPNINMVPYISEIYAKYNYRLENFKIPVVNASLNEVNINTSLGRQRKNFIEGLVVGDNGVGYDGVFLEIFVDKYFYFETMFSKILSISSFLDNKYFSLNTFLLGSKFFEEFDFGVCNTIENNKFLNDKKIFYEFFLKRQLENYYYIFEYAIQKGKKENKDYSGSLWFFKAGAFGESKYLGTSKAEVVWLLSSGGGDESIFYPTFSKTYDGLEPYGWGNFARGNLKSIFFDLPDGYSGMFILGFNVTLNPFKKFFSGLEYYLYSSPEAPSDKPDPSSTEKTLGAKKAIGLEYGIFTTYKFNSYIDINFDYSIFIPSKNVYFEKNTPATKISLSAAIRF